MDALARHLFDDPMYVYLGSAVVSVLFVTSYWINRKRWLLIGAAAAALVIPAALAIDLLVETDREEILAISRRIAAEYEQRSLQTVSKRLADSYSGLGVDRGGLLNLARQQLARDRTVEVRITSAEVVIHGRQAEMGVVTAVDISGQLEGRVLLNWDVLWRKDPDGWQIVEVSRPDLGAGLFGN